MKDVVEYIVKSLCDSPDEVEVKLENDEDFYIIRIFVASSDMGRVIGKNGKVATSIRTIVNSLSSKQDKKRYIVKIEEK